MWHVRWYTLPGHATVIQGNYLDEKIQSKRNWGYVLQEFEKRPGEDTTGHKAKQNLVCWTGWTVKGPTEDQKLYFIKKTEIYDDQIIKM